MATIKEEAQAYTPPQTKNIAELEFFSVSEEMHTGQGKDKDNEVFTYKYIQRDGIEYRVPGSVIGAIKSILERQPGITTFQVLKSGEGMNTRYQVIPYVGNSTRK